MNRWACAEHAPSGEHGSLMNRNACAEEGWVLTLRGHARQPAVGPTEPGGFPPAPCALEDGLALQMWDGSSSPRLRNAWPIHSTQAD